MSSSHLAQLFGVNNTVGGGYIEGVSCDSHERSAPHTYTTAESHTMPYLRSAIPR